MRGEARAARKSLVATLAKSPTPQRRARVPEHPLANLVIDTSCPAPCAHNAGDGGIILTDDLHALSSVSTYPREVHALLIQIDGLDRCPQHFYVDATVFSSIHTSGHPEPLLTNFAARISFLDCPMVLLTFCLSDPTRSHH